MARSTFRRGSGCFTCTQCGKRTRDTDGHNGSVGLCPKCRDEGEQLNAHSDGVHERYPAPAICPACRKVA